MVHPLKKQTWLDRAVAIHKFHIDQCKEDSTWSLRKTAATLDRSLGSISQDVMIGSWMKTHEKQLRKFRSSNDALKFIRSKQKEMRFGFTRES